MISSTLIFSIWTLAGTLHMGSEHPLPHADHPCNDEPPAEMREALEIVVLVGSLICEGFWISYLRSNREIRELEEKGGIVRHTSEELFTPDLSFSNTWRVECRRPRFTGIAADLNPILHRLKVVDLTVHAAPDMPLGGEFLTELSDDELIKLDLEHVVVDELSIQCLAKNSNNLVNLRLHCPSLNDSQLELLDRCPRLLQLTIASDGITDRSLAVVLTTSMHLDSLEVSGKKIDGSFLDRLAGPLYSLRMDYCDVTNGALKSLHQFPDLEVLSIAESRRLNDEAMQSVSFLKSLVGLNMSGTAIGNVGLSKLANLESLRTLILDNCKGIGDDCIETLCALPALERLSIQKTSLSESGVKLLRERLPDCVIAVSDQERWVNPFSGTILDLD